MARPLLLLAGVGEQVLHDGAAAAASSMGKSVWPGTQPSCDGQVPGARLLALADDDLDAVVLHVERLALALDAVADDGDRLLVQICRSRSGG